MDFDTPLCDRSLGKLERMLVEPPCTKCGTTSIPYIPCLPKSVVDNELSVLRTEVTMLKIALQRQERTINRVIVVIVGLFTSLFVLKTCKL